MSDRVFSDTEILGHVCSPVCILMCGPTSATSVLYSMNRWQSTEPKRDRWEPSHGRVGCWLPAADSSTLFFSTFFSLSFFQV